MSDKTLDFGAEDIFSDSDKCYECDVDMSNVKSYWTKFIGFGNKTYQVKICDECNAMENEKNKQETINKIGQVEFDKLQEKERMAHASAEGITLN